MPPGLPMPGMAGLSMPTRAGQSWGGSERRSRNQVSMYLDSLQRGRTDTLPYHISLTLPLASK